MPFQRAIFKGVIFFSRSGESEQKKPFIFKRLMKLENYLLWLSKLEPSKNQSGRE